MERRPKATTRVARLLVGGGCLAALLLAGPARAWGWGYTWAGTALEQIVNTARWKVGSFRANAAFRLDNSGWSNDIYFGNSLTPVPDWTLRAGPDVRIFYPWKGRIVVDLAESPRYVFYLHTTKDRSWNNDFRGNVHFVMKKFYVQVGGTSIDAKEFLSSELFVNIRRRENGVNGAVLWQLSPDSSLAMQFTGRKLVYAGGLVDGIDIRANLNRTESVLRAIAFLQQTKSARIFLTADYGTYVFSEITASYKDAQSYALLGGINFIPAAPEEGTASVEGTRGIQGGFNLGYRFFDMRDPAQKDYSGLVGNGNLTIGVLPLTTINATFTRSVQYSAYSGGTYYNLTSFGLGLTRNLSQRVALSYMFNYGKNDYPKVSEAQVARLVGFTTHNFQATFNLKEYLSVSLIGSLGRRTASLEVGEVDKRNFFGISLIYGFASNESMSLASQIGQ